MNTNLRSFVSVRVHSWLTVRKQLSKDEVNDERDPEADEPRVIIEAEQKRRDVRAVDDFARREETGQAGQDAGGERDEGHHAETIFVGILSLGIVEPEDVEPATAHDEIV